MKYDGVSEFVYVQYVHGALWSVPYPILPLIKIVQTATPKTKTQSFSFSYESSAHDCGARVLHQMWRYFCSIVNPHIGTGIELQTHEHISQMHNNASVHFSKSWNGRSNSLN